MLNTGWNEHPGRRIRERIGKEERIEPLLRAAKVEFRNRIQDEAKERIDALRSLAYKQVDKALIAIDDKVGGRLGIEREQSTPVGYSDEWKDDFDVIWDRLSSSYATNKQVESSFKGFESINEIEDLRDTQYWDIRFENIPGDIGSPYPFNWIPCTDFKLGSTVTSSNKVNGTEYLELISGHSNLREITLEVYELADFSFKKWVERYIEYMIVHKNGVPTKQIRPMKDCAMKIAIYFLDRNQKDVLKYKKYIVLPIYTLEYVATKESAIDKMALTFKIIGEEI